MDKLKEIAALISAVNAIAIDCKDAFGGIKSYRRNPRRLAYALQELLAETTTLHAHAATLRNFVQELCAACTPCSTEPNGTPEPEEVHHAHMVCDP